MSVATVKEYLKQYNKDGDVMEFEVSSATVELAAEAVGVIPARIAKTLSFLLKDNSCVLIVAAGDAKIDNPKYKHFFSAKAKMLTAEEVIDFTGHAIGGVCPFGVNEGIPVYLDESLRRFDYVYPAAGTSASAVYLTLPELERASEYIGWVNVTK